MRKTKKGFNLALIFLMLVFLFSLPAEAFQDPPAGKAAAPQAKSDLQILLNGDELITGIPYFIEGGRTLVPARFFGEAMGAAVSWHSSAKTISVALDDIFLEMAIGGKTALLNGSPVALETPVRLLENRAYLPLRFIAESLGADVSWNSADRRIMVELPSLGSKPGREGHQLPLSYYQDLQVQVDTYGISLGDPGQKVLDLLGEPARRDETVYGYRWWIYNRDYHNYLQVGIKNGFVVTLYTPGEKWNFGPLHRGCGLDLLNDHFETADRLFVEKEKVIYKLYLPTLVYNNLVATFYCDEQDNHKITAVRLEDRGAAEDKFGFFYKYRSRQGARDSFDPEKMRAAEAAEERQIFDLANTERSLRGLPPLDWNGHVALAALEHSREMYDYNYFDHFSPVTGVAVDHRLDKHGIKFTLAAENIARGQLDGIEVHHGLMNSLLHRENILHENLRSLGVGVYGDCYTQNFITALR